MPNWKDLVRERLAVLRLPPAREIEIVEEVALHLEAIYEEALLNCLSESEAQARAVQSNDWHLLECELSRVERPWQPSLATVEWLERKGGMRMESLWQDLRLGARMLSKQRAFALIAVITLALGIGATTTIFSLISAVLLRPLPFADAQQLVIVWQTHPDLLRVGPSLLDFADWRARTQSFSEMAIYANRFRNARLTGVAEPARVQGTMISPNFFSMLGLQPMLGRTFTADDDKAGNNQVVILSRTLWQQRFASDPQIVGRAIQLNERAYTVIGVMDEQYPLQIDLWLPLSQLSGDAFTSRKSHVATAVLARLKPNVTVAQANQELQSIAAQLEQSYPDSNKSLGAVGVPLRDYLTEKLDAVPWLAFAAVALILLIACANVANLFLTRALARQRELFVRAALGASRSRLVRQLLTESFLIALLSGLLGLLLARLCLPWLATAWLRLGNDPVQGLDNISFDWRTLLFTVGLMTLTSLLFGGLPAWQVSRIRLNQAMKEGGNGAIGAGRRNVSTALLVAEVALAVIVTVSAGLLVRSLQTILRVEPGFRTDHVLSVKAVLPDTKYIYGSEETKAYYRKVIPQLEALPSVQSVAVCDWVPFISGKNQTRYVLEGESAEAGRDRLARTKSVDHRLFATLRIPLRQGRYFEEADLLRKSNKQIIINETMARRFTNTANPVGKHLDTDWGKGFEIIGVVADTKDLGLIFPVEPELYFPVIGTEAVFMVQTANDPASLTALVRQTLLANEPQQSIVEMGSVDELLTKSLARRRFILALIASAAAIALGLAALGIYSIVAYSVTQRTSEIGIRLALGAQPRNVRRLVIAQGMKPALVGVGLGLLGAAFFTRWVKNLLFNVAATDLPTFALSGLGLLVVALLACYRPAQRATRIDPLAALRHE